LYRLAGLSRKYFAIALLLGEQPLDKRYHIWYLLSMRWVVEYYEQADTTQPPSLPDLTQASEYWRDYQHTHKISPEVPEQEEQS
jgi:hypothetical protein